MSEKSTDKPEIKYQITPTSHFNYENLKKEWNLEVHLPGVDKSKVKFRVLPTLFDLEAIRDQAQYSLHGHFPWEIDVDSVSGKYENGLLYISGKVKNPLDDAFHLQVK
ncbi:Hsp20/alpha crystallin family protein [Candidatus Lokiarchaeum ossiferum]|uniref:Hsp20/alpha crystallin family protein n=1 Tax=Candidatus Lokiarchaeum ossiferum TaxID=2951803 RepID=UPI00352F63D3